MKLPAKGLVRDLVAQVLYVVGLSRRPSTSRLVIATFHRVLPDAELADYPLKSIAVTPDELAWFIDLFKQYFECGTLERCHDLWRRGGLTRPLLALTFDDGQRDNFRHARPVLDRAGVRASFFVPTEAVQTGTLLWHDRAAYALGALQRRLPAAAVELAREVGVAPSTAPDRVIDAAVQRLKQLSATEREAWIEKLETRVGGGAVPIWDKMMSFDELTSLDREGHEIGSHSHTHPILTGLSDDLLRTELELSKQVLERQLGHVVTSLCYPNGNADGRVVEAARAAGYQRAVTTQWGGNRAGADAFTLARCDMQSTTARSARGRLSPARVAWRISNLDPRRT